MAKSQRKSSKKSTPKAQSDTLKKAAQNIKQLEPRRPLDPEPNWRDIAFDTAHLLDDVLMFMWPRTEEEAKLQPPVQKEFLKKKAQHFEKLFFTSKESGRLVNRQENSRFKEIWERISRELHSNRKPK